MFGAVFTEVADRFDVSAHCDDNLRPRRRRLLRIYGRKTSGNYSDQLATHRCQTASHQAEPAFR